MKLEQARRFALSLPEAIDEHRAAAVTKTAAAFEELWWGTRIVGVRVNLPAADARSVFELLEESWGTCG